MLYLTCYLIIGSLTATYFIYRDKLMLEDILHPVLTMMLLLVVLLWPVVILDKILNLIYKEYLDFKRSW